MNPLRVNNGLVVTRNIREGTWKMQDEESEERNSTHRKYLEMMNSILQTVCCLLLVVRKDGDTILAAPSASDYGNGFH